MSIKKLFTHSLALIGAALLLNESANAQFGGFVKEVNKLANELSKKEKTQKAEEAQMGQGSQSNYIESPYIAREKQEIINYRRELENKRYKPDIARIEAKIAESEQNIANSRSYEEHWNAGTKPIFLSKDSEEEWFYLEKIVAEMKANPAASRFEDLRGQLSYRESTIQEFEHNAAIVRKRDLAEAKEAKEKAEANRNAQAKTNAEAAARPQAIAAAVSDNKDAVAAFGLKNEVLEAKYYDMTLREILSILVDSPDQSVFVENSIMYGDFILVVKFQNGNLIKWGFKNEYGDLHLKATNFASRGNSDPVILEFMTFNTDNEGFFSELLLRSMIDDGIKARSG